MKFYTIGVLGGGQLGRMMALAARRMGMNIAVLDPDPDAPAGQVADRHVVGSFRDVERIRELARGCDVVTIEIEHIDVNALEMLAGEGVAVQPAPQTIRLIQDKYLQKVHLAQHGFPLPPFREVTSLADVEGAAEAFGFPLVLKARRGAYDGRGNMVIRAHDQIGEAMATLSNPMMAGGAGLYAEGWCPFEKELAVIVARSASGQMADYPVVETIQRDDICHVVLAPAQISGVALSRARDMARRAVATLDGAGVFGVEMFLTSDDQVFLNEIAPRPHNSGHYTIEGCPTSQFEQHIRAITGLSLGSAEMIPGAAAMINVLGMATPEITHHVLDDALKYPNASIHWYGKREVRPGRKVGHVTLTAGTMEDLAEPLLKLAGVQIDAMPLVGIIMGSDSDLPTMREAAVVLRDFGIPFELTIVSAHRTPERMVEYARDAHLRGLKVIIAGAGGAAHLPGMVAALTPLPVIGVPVAVGPLNGQDALYAIVQMPRGVPVATVAIGGAANAGLLAARILATDNPQLRQRMQTYQEALAASTLYKANQLETRGWE
jgi:phosphoribosylaminoimidazole carboxylase